MKINETMNLIQKTTKWSKARVRAVIQSGNNNFHIVKTKRQENEEAEKNCNIYINRD